MTTDWINIISSVGFPIVLVLIGINAISKHTPTLLRAWNDFTKALDSLSHSVSQNSTITQNQYDKFITVEDYLKKAIALLEDHHDNAVGMKDQIGDVKIDVGNVKVDVGEMQNLLIELAEQIQALYESRKL